MTAPEIKNSGVILGSIIQASYEVIFVLIPAFVWVLVLLSLGKAQDVGTLAAWPFASLSLFCATLRDGISAYHQDITKDKVQKDLIVVSALTGVVLSTVLLTLAVLKSSGQIPYLWSFFYEIVRGFVVFGAVLLFVTKAILIQRKSYGRCV
jgi:hypothetical protein